MSTVPAPYDPLERRPETVGELETWLMAMRSHQPGVGAWPVEFKSPALDLLAALSCRHYDVGLIPSSLRRLRAEYVIRQRVSQEQADATKIEAFADALAGRGSTGGTGSGTEEESAEAAPPPGPPCRHGRDFRSVLWFGQIYAFSPDQAAAVQLLWEAWENGTPDLAEATIRTEGEFESRLAHIFRGHAAWGAMIAPGNTKGTFRLQKPA